MISAHLKCIEFNERNLFVPDFRWNNKIVKRIIDQEWIMKKHKNNSGLSKFGNQSKDYKYSDQFRGVVKGQALEMTSQTVVLDWSLETK